MGTTVVEVKLLDSAAREYGISRYKATNLVAETAVSQQ